MTAAKQTPWRSTVEDNASVVETDGDIFAPLKRVRQQYYDAANKLVKRRTTDEGIESKYVEAANALRDCGDRVGKLISIGSECEEATGAIETGSTGYQQDGTSLESSNGYTSGPEDHSVSQENQATNTGDNNSQPEGFEGSREGSQVS